MSDKKPMVLFFAGPNGSGKSTITKYFEIVGTYTNADDMVASTSMSNKEAALIADEMRYKAIENKQDFTFETVLSSHYKLEILEKAKKFSTREICTLRSKHLFLPINPYIFLYFTF